jgi:hypothetical protein
MTVIPDGGRVAYSTFALRPKASADISGGKVLHITGEWDAHNDDRRWQDIFIMPKGDYLFRADWRGFGFNPTKSFNSVVVDIGHSAAVVTQWDVKGTVGQNTAPLDSHYLLAGNSDTTDFKSYRCTKGIENPSQVGYDNWANGHDNDNDNRHRFDVYLSQTHIKVYEEGMLKVDWTMTIPLSYTQIDVQFVHHLYHSALEHDEILTGFVQPEVLWRDRTPYTDQRHWDNLGFEVLTKMP